MGAQNKSSKKEISPDQDQKDVTNMFKNILEMPGEKQKQRQIKYPQILCPEKFIVSAMCISKTCTQDSMMCENPQCSICAKAHNTCGLVKLSAFTTLMQNRSNMHQQLIDKIQKIEFRVFGNLKARRQAHLERYFLNGFGKKYLPFVESLYFNGDQFNFKGVLAEEVYQKLKESNAEMAKTESQILRGFNRQIQRIAASLTVLEGQIIKQYTKKIKMEEIASQSRIVQKQALLESKIIPPQRVDDIKFIYQSLDWPAEIQLLFRASENGYLGSKFHAACDNIPHTVTIIRTEFGKVIAGYTPITWNMVKGIAADQTKQSFLLSLDLRQKMNLIRSEKAIQCIATQGPVFGGGSDLAVTNLCHMNLTSCTNFPFSYNCEGKYVYNQEAWTALTGVKQGKLFKIDQYEVYKIIW